MTRNGMPRIERVAALLTLGLLVAACGSAAATATPVPISATQAPATATATLAPAATPTATPTAALTATPAPSGTPTPAPAGTPAPTATPAPTPAPATSPTASPATLAGGCTASSTTKPFFGQAQQAVRFPVYCAVLPSDYWVTAGTYDGANGGLVQVDYTNGRGFRLQLVEGNMCLENGCKVNRLFDQGKLWLGDMGATLFRYPTYDVVVANRADQPPMYMAWVQVSPSLAYGFLGQGMSEATFVKLAAAVIKVPPISN